MRPLAIKIDNLSKLYRLGQVGTGTLAHDLNRWWHKVRGKEDPYRKIGSINYRTEKKESQYVWALRHIDLEIRQGEVLGIIGANGAGKSTLLKILSKVTGPTEGRIFTKGRIASLLEVGTGFHSELTGRENIFLNGTILGMTKAEVSRKLDEIVDFAGVERYIDTPVKRYSSGMIVRLGFAVAAHLDPEILIVDEVLAVGDAKFQQKAIGKIQAVSQDEGRTVLFVSHNMGSIRRLCTQAVHLKHGQVEGQGEVDTIIEQYLKKKISGSPIEYISDYSDILALRSIALRKTNNDLSTQFELTEPIVIEVTYEVLQPVSGAHLSLAVKNANSDIVFRTWDIDESPATSHKMELGTFVARVQIPANLLNIGQYSLYLASALTRQMTLRKLEDVLSFEVLPRNENLLLKSYMYGGNIVLPLKWDIQKSSS